MDDETVLEIDGLSVHIRGEDGRTTIVDDVSFDLHRNEVLCVVGESGSGKSVTMLSVMRLMDERVASYDGQVRFDGVDLLKLGPRAIRRVRGAGIAMIFQDPMTALSPVQTIGWQITEQLNAHQSLSRGQARTRVLELLTVVGISDPERRMDAYPHQLSGGMRQRVMIALALSCRPRVLIADEPTTALDVTIQAQILSLITELKEKTGMAIILVTHDMGVVAEMADRVQVMYAGRTVEEGMVQDLFDNPHHPYTWGLLASIPRLDLPPPHRLPSIPGAPATAGQVGGGCVFLDRCSFRFDRCTTRPELGPAGLDQRHRVACHLSESQRQELRPTRAVADGAPT